MGRDVINNNEGRLIALCEQNNMKIMNGFLQHRDIHKYTWRQDTRGLRPMIDFAILKQITKVKVQRWGNTKLTKIKESLPGSSC